MVTNKKVVETYMGCKGTEYASFLADDVELIEWADGVPASGVRTQGRDAFVLNRGTREYQTHITRMIEENNVVIAEGIAFGDKKDGGNWRVQFSDIYELENGKVKRLTSYGADVKNATDK